MKNILIILIFLTSFTMAQAVPNLLNHPNVSIVGIESETDYVHPSQLLKWLEQRKPNNIRFGQMGCCVINGKSLAISVPHVIRTPGWQKPLKPNSNIGDWIDSADGREIAFAEIKNSTSLGFSTKPIDAANAINQHKGSIQSTCFNPQTMSIDEFEMSGTVEIISDKEHIKVIADFFQRTNPESAISKRLNVKAPDKPILFMPVEEKFRPLVRGASGSLLYQDGKPVGVFIATMFVDKAPPLLLAEPILDSAKNTLKE